MLSPGRNMSAEARMPGADVGRAGGKIAETWVEGYFVARRNHVVHVVYPAVRLVEPLAGQYALGADMILLVDHDRNVVGLVDDRRGVSVAVEQVVADEMKLFERLALAGRTYPRYALWSISPSSGDSAEYTFCVIASELSLSRCAGNL